MKKETNIKNRSLKTVFLVLLYGVSMLLKIKYLPLTDIDL